MFMNVVDTQENTSHEIVARVGSIEFDPSSVGAYYVTRQAFDDSKAAGRIANMGLEKLGAMSAGLGDKLNDNADKALNKARALEVKYLPAL